jgi:hypothetical protein
MHIFSESITNAWLNYSVNIPGLDFKALDDTGSVQAGGVPDLRNTSDLDPWLALNCNLFRFPFLWNYIQPTFESEFDSKILDNLDTLVNYVTNRGAYAIVDVVC